jgi:hypothetical protein
MAIELPRRRETKPAPTVKDFLMARRRVKELPEGTALREEAGGVRCKEPGCNSTGVTACQHPLGGHKVGSTCGREICLDHAGLNAPGRKKGDPVLCSSHRRHPNVGRR